MIIKTFYQSRIESCPIVQGTCVASNIAAQAAIKAGIQKKN